MMSSRHLCLTVLLFTLFGAIFCARSVEQLSRALVLTQLADKSDSALAGIMYEVAELCEINGNSGEADNVKFQANKLMSGDWDYADAVKGARYALRICPLLGDDGVFKLGPF
ncbi:uncharacterized protein LOC141851252 [Brevipalpus obovatus]|uniref:uncharacterized protein LOC141851252 n=1 Tax=Brevipalpus obovatus TaxID=246614 RepID=UPI003D9F2A45